MKRIQIKNNLVLYRLTAWLLGASLVVVSCRGGSGRAGNHGNARMIGQKQQRQHQQYQHQQEEEYQQEQQQIEPLQVVGPQQDYLHHFERPSSQSPYRIVIDGGSTGSRLHVFQFHKDAPSNDNDNGNDHAAAIKCTRRGSSRANIPLSAFADQVNDHHVHSNATHVAQHLLPLFYDAAQIIPPQYHATTTVHYQATAGMRLLDINVQDAIYDALYEGLMEDDNFVFRSLKRGDISTLGGEKEALYGAIAANYLKGVVDVNLHMIETNKEEETEDISGEMKTGQNSDMEEDYYDGPLGALDMGGASMQIVYLPHINDDEVIDSINGIDEDTAEFQNEGHAHHDIMEEPLPMPSLPNKLNGEEFFSTSYLSYGADQFRERLWWTWVRERELDADSSSQDVVSSKIIENPCSFPGYLVEWEGYTFLGTGDAAKCSEEISRLIPHHEDSMDLNTNVSAVANDLSNMTMYPTNRQVGGVEHPPIRGHFFAMSLFFFTLDCLRELSEHKSLNDTWPTPSINDLTSALHNLCSRSWKDDLELIQENAHEFTRPQVLPDRCFESVYMVTLLRDGFGFEPESRDITFTFLVEGSEVEWSLGLAISHFAEEHSPAVTMNFYENEEMECDVPARDLGGGKQLSHGPILKKLNVLYNAMTTYYYR